MVWNKENLNIIIESIKEAQNTCRGLDLAAKKLKVSYMSCHSAYYKYIPKQKRPKIKSKRILIKWTKPEEKLLLKYTSENPNNLFQAFEKVAKETGRTTVTVQQHWQRIKKNSSIVFTTIGKKTQSPNTKNLPYDSSEKPEKHSIWSKLKKLLKI